VVYTSYPRVTLLFGLLLGLAVSVHNFFPLLFDEGQGVA